MDCQCHMDDVNWLAAVHSERGCTGSPWFRWFGGGSSLNEVRIQCPKCDRAANFGEAYSRSWTCSGRFPEREGQGQAPSRPGGCPARAKIVQRQASNLRIPELRTLFTIPPRATRLHNLLQNRDLRVALAVNPPGTKDQLNAGLQRLRAANLISPVVVQEILQHDWDEIQSVLRDLQAPVATSFGDLLIEEFHQLIKASIDGYPQSHSRTNRPTFEVNPSLVRRLSALPVDTLRLVPISRLQTVTVQSGYTRAISSDQTPTSVTVAFEDENKVRWFPGVQFLGEGVFLMFDSDDGWQSEMTTEAACRWLGADRQSYDDFVFRNPARRDELHPVFVWWHTLSHLLMRAIAVDAGYSSAAIRERIYFELDEAGKKARGGLVLYATQPGSEGSLGGMIALAPHFEGILQRAFQMADRCSNDPLCAEHTFSSGKCSGAACYSCLLVSETSCEHRNLWLDRTLLL